MRRSAPLLFERAQGFHAFCRIEHEGHHVARNGVGRARSATVLDHHRAGVFRFVEGCEEHEQAVVAIFPWTRLAVRNAQRNHLRGTRFPGHENVIERQAGAPGRAGSIDRVAHRLANVSDLFGAEVEMLELRFLIGQAQARHDPVAGREACAHHRQLQRTGEIVALADGRVNRVVGLPLLIEFLLLPRRIGHGAVELAGDGKGEFFAQTHFMRPFRHMVETDLLGEMIEIAVAALVDGLGHVHRAVIAPAVEEPIADAPAAATDNRLFRLHPCIEEGHAMHRLDRRTGWIKTLEHLVAQRHALVIAQHGIFHAADALREAVRIEARHGGHAEDIAGLAIHDHAGSAFEPDAARGVVLQRAVYRKANGIALDVFARFEVAHDPARCRNLHSPRAGDAAQVQLELLFQRVLADLVAGGDEQRVAVLLFVFLGIGGPDIAD